MGNPAGPDKQYCSSCGEVIDRDSSFCTYCGAEVKDRAFPTDRSGPATASDGQSFGDSHQPRGDAGASRRSGQGTGGDRYPDESYETRQTAEMSAVDNDEFDRDFASARVGMGSVGRPRVGEPLYRSIGTAIGLGVGGVILLAIISAVAGLALLPVLPNLAAFGLATVIGQYISFIGFGLWYLRRRGYDWSRISSYFGVRRPSLKELGMVILGWVVILVLISIVGFIVQTFLPEPAQNEGTSMLADYAGNVGIYLGAVLFMFLVVGPSEEILYRGVVQNRLRERLPAFPAILMASLVFAAVHVVALAGNPVAMATTVGILFVPAIVLGLVYEYTGNIVVPALLHGLHNSVIITVLFFGPEEPESTEFIAGVLAGLPL